MSISSYLLPLVYEEKSSKEKKMDEMKKVDKALEKEDKIVKKEARKIDRAFEQRDSKELENLEETEAEADQMLADGTYDEEAKSENFDEYMSDDEKYEAKAVRKIVRAFDEAVNEKEKACCCCKNDQQ